MIGAVGQHVEDRHRGRLHGLWNIWEYDDPAADRRHVPPHHCHRRRRRATYHLQAAATSSRPADVEHQPGPRPQQGARRAERETVFSTHDGRRQRNVAGLVQQSTTAARRCARATSCSLGSRRRPQPLQVFRSGRTAPTCSSSSVRQRGSSYSTRATWIGGTPPASPAAVRHQRRPDVRCRQLLRRTPATGMTGAGIKRRRRHGRGLSQYSRISTPYPLWDGTDRVLVSCREVGGGAVVSCDDRGREVGSARRATRTSGGRTGTTCARRTPSHVRPGADLLICRAGGEMPHPVRSSRAPSRTRPSRPTSTRPSRRPTSACSKCVASTTPTASAAWAAAS